MNTPLMMYSRLQWLKLHELFSMYQMTKAYQHNITSLGQCETSYQEPINHLESVLNSQIEMNYILIQMSCSFADSRTSWRLG